MMIDEYTHSISKELLSKPQVPPYNNNNSGRKIGNI
jgi:hypothetical protein